MDKYGNYIIYHKWRKIRWAKLAFAFSRFSRVPQKFSVNIYLYYTSFSVKNFIGWNLQKFSPANLPCLQ